MPDELMKQVMLTDEEIWDSYAPAPGVYRSCQDRDIAKAQAAKAIPIAYRAGETEELEELIAWAIEERRQLKEKRQQLRVEKPTDIQVQMIQRAKEKVWQQVIIKCRERRQPK